MVGITLQSGPFRRINYVKHRADPVANNHEQSRKIPISDQICPNHLTNQIVHSTHNMKAANRSGNRKTTNGNRYHKQTGSNLKPVYPKTGLQNGSETGLENGS